MEIISGSWSNACTPMFTVASFTRARIQRQPRCPTTDKWKSKMWYARNYSHYVGYNLCSSIISKNTEPLCCIPETNIICKSTIVVVQSLSHIWLCATPQTAALQASLSSLPEFAQTHVHWFGDAIQPSYSLLSPSPGLSLSQHQGPLQWVDSSHEVAKVLEV